MQLKRKISSHFLLTIYLLVVGSQLAQHTHSSEIAVTISHEHENTTTVHHEHFFHVGIFHFLGHIFETIVHQDDVEGDNPAIINVQNTLTKKVINNAIPAHFFFHSNNTVVFDVDAESLPDPPYQLFLLQRLRQPNTPLRAPPVVV